MTPAQRRRRQIARAIEANPAASDRVIAKLAGVDHKTVAAHRREQATTGELPAAGGEFPTGSEGDEGMEPTYSAREAAALLGRSYSWLDQRLRAGQFVLPDGTAVRPLRTQGSYRRFTTRCSRTSL